MKRVTLLLLLISCHAYAQQPDAEKQALGQMIVEAAQREAALKTQVIDLQRQLEAAKKAQSSEDHGPRQP